MEYTCEGVEWGLYSYVRALADIYYEGSYTPMCMHVLCGFFSVIRVAIEEFKQEDLESAIAKVPQTGHIPITCHTVYIMPYDSLFFLILCI